MYGIRTMPAGLFGDEAAEGRDALRIISGERPVYLEANFGREPLHAYLVALSVSAFGRTPAAVRLPSALAACATIVGLFGLTRRLFGTRAGLIAAFLCAFSVWAVMLGRLATRPALLPCVLAFALWAGISGWQRRDARRWVAAGLLFGLALYTYTPIRVIIFIVPVWLLVVGIHGSMRRMWPGVIYGAIGFVVCALPLIVYGASHPEVLFAAQARAQPPTVRHPCSAPAHRLRAQTKPQSGWLRKQSTEVRRPQNQLRHKSLPATCAACCHEFQLPRATRARSISSPGSACRCKAPAQIAGPQPPSALHPGAASH